ncbi:MAG TPA: helix-turn-helix domain-containing protein [Pyrinomonadaceae bacterium]|nr:helix-turn-helix domain-containing protein [Pyrinomonadaceae bacterium]
MTSKTSEQTSEGESRDGAAGGSLGQQLRRAREALGVSLRDVSEQTRITMRHLEAIEADDYKHLPGGIFNKSFIKSYARHVRFDEQRALALYERTMRERGEGTDEVLTSPQRSRIYIGDTARSPLVTYVLSAVIVGILILIVYAGLHYYRRTEGPQPAAQATPTPSAQGTAATQATPQPPPPADKLSVTVKANAEVWMRVLVDDETAKGNAGQTWQAGQSRTFDARDKLTLNYARSMTGALEVTANGSTLRAPADTRPGVSQEWVITKDNFRQFAQ